MSDDATYSNYWADLLNTTCRHRLGFDYIDASFLYPDQTEAIVQELVAQRWPHLKDNQ